jgi:hypothetical protein
MFASSTAHDDKYSKASSSVFSLDGNMLTLYLGAAALGVLVFQSFTDLGLSTLTTLSVGIQCFGYLCLRLKISQQKSVAGISGRTLVLQALSIGLRLCSTTWLKGYIPVDGTGDFLYQLLDVITLLMVMQIIYCVFKSHRQTYQQEHDNCNVHITALGCFVLAVLVHPDLNNRPLFDTLWTTALYIDVVAMMPQLAMMAKIRGKVEALTSHYVGATAVSRAISLVFWFHGYAELAPLDGSFNLAGWAVLSAHIVQTLLLLDFLFYYIRACVTSGCHPRMELSGVVDV